MDAQTLRSWIEKRGFAVSAEGEHTLKVAWTADFAVQKPLPPLFVQVAENWVVLSVLAVEIAPAYALVGLARALLAFNRKIPLAKFAFGQNDETILCAELPTESLDEPELMGTVETLLDALRSYGAYGPMPRESE
ncbi:MAG: hypothetical protein R3B70_01905 [Polyangiaceae bacterium]